MTDLTPILDALARAESSGFTDDDQEELRQNKTPRAKAYNFSQEIIDACEKANFQGMELADVFDTLTKTLAILIASNMKEKVFSLMAVEIAHAVMKKTILDFFKELGK